MKGALLEAIDKNCGQTKGQARHKETWWLNVSNCVSEKCKLRKDWKQGKTSKRKYVEAKKKAKRTVYQAKYKAERERSGNNMWQEDQKCDVLRLQREWSKLIRILFLGST